MTLEEMENRLQMLVKQQEQLTANYNMLEGGKQECLFWIKNLKDKSQEKEINAIDNANS